MPLSFSSVLQLGRLVLVVRVIMRTLINTVCICSSHPEAENKGQVVLMRDQARQFYLCGQMFLIHIVVLIFGIQEKKNYSVNS